MDLSLFRDLARLHDTGHFSRAAAMGNLSQPAFSRRIKSLEAWVGVTLVDRSRQPVHLTEAGRQMLEAGLQALDRIEQERNQIRQAKSLPESYVVTFGTQHSIGWRFYPAWLQTLEDSYGPILSRLRADDLPNCLRDLQGGDVDFVIAYQSPETAPVAKFPSTQIGTDRLIPVCKPRADGAPLYDLAAQDVKMPYLRFGDAAPISAHLKPLFARHRIRARLNTVYENAMAGALRIRARAGDGVAWLPQSLVSPDLDTGQLIRTGPDDWHVDLEIRLFRNPEHSHPATTALWRYFREGQAPQTSHPMSHLK